MAGVIFKELKIWYAKVNEEIFNLINETTLKREKTEIVILNLFQDLLILLELKIPK